MTSPPLSSQLQHSPPPPIQSPKIILAQLPSPFHLGRQPFQASAHCPCRSQRHLVREDVQHGKDEETQTGQSGTPSLRKDPVDQRLGFAEGVFSSVVGALAAMLAGVRASVDGGGAEEGFD